MSELRASRSVLEVRAAEVLEVGAGAITLRVAPYDEPANVNYRGRMVEERIAAGAFAGVERRPKRVGLNRDHDHGRLVGRGVEFLEDRAGLVGRFVVADSELGRESLELAEVGAVGASVEMRVEQHVLTSTARRVTRAWLEAVGLVPTSAYEGAEVLRIERKAKTS